MHADEANQAVKTGELLESGRYAFDPKDHHGPTLYYFGAVAALARGQHTLAALTESTVRFVPAVFGVLCVILVACFAHAAADGPSDDGVSDSRAGFSPPSLLGRTALSTQGELKPALLSDTRANRAPLSVEALLAAAFLCVCPAAVYYSRYYIHETLLLGLMWLSFFSIVRARRTGGVGWLCIAGCAVGCALATKETAVLFLGLALIAYVLSRFGNDVLPRAERKLAGWQWSVAAAVAVCTAATFYSSFGTHFGGIRGAITAPFAGLERAASGSGHEKPWWYYFSLLGWQRQGGLLWHQFPLTFLAFVGAVAGWQRRHVRCAAIYAAGVLIAISAVPYKTPWNVIHVLPALALLAAAGVVAIGRLRTGRIVATAFVFMTVASLLAQSYRVAFKYGADARNPYAYVHSSPDVLKFRPMVEAALASKGEALIRVIGPEYWPLPWYLRGMPHVGYWSEPPADCDGKVVVTAAELAGNVRGRLHQQYRERYLGLRPGYTMVVFIAEEGTP